MKKIFNLITCFSTMILFHSCYYDIEEELYGTICDTTLVTYSATIKPMVDQNCVVCHATGSSLGGGIELDTYSGLFNMSNSGNLVGAIRHDPGFSAMPKGGAQLSSCDVAKIETWVNSGSPNN